MDRGSRPRQLGRVGRQVGREDILDAFAAGADPSSRTTAARATVAVIEAAYRSAEPGERIEIGRDRADLGPRPGSAVTERILQEIKADSSLTERVRDSIREAIIDGRLEPGSLHSVQTLAATFGVSRTPVREALIDLEGTGHGRVRTQPRGPDSRDLGP